MIRTVVIAIAISLASLYCTGQVVDAGKKTDQSAPKTNIKVTREYDKNGNIVKYDSSYSYFFSNIEGDTGLTFRFFDDFNNQSDDSIFFSKRPRFKDFIFGDSLFLLDFYRMNYLYNSFNKNMQNLDLIFNEMDSHEK